jgi:hypothetical protein
MRSRSAAPASSHASTSCATHSERAASSDAKRIKNREVSRAERMDRQRSGVTPRPVVSRKTRIARRRYHGLANACKLDCMTSVSRPSAAWLYDMKAVYRNARPSLISRLERT